MDGTNTPSLTDRILASQPDAKAAAVLGAGYETFLQFGLRRASMQDIADRAGMSRAALYLHFRNKNDIFRAMMEAYFNAAAEAAAEALGAHDDTGRALMAAFEAQLGDAAEALMKSPHVDEILSEKHASGDVMRDGQAKLVGVYTRWLEAGVTAGRIAPGAVAGNASRTAQVMLSALDGLKQGGFDWPAYVEARRHLARIFAAALTAEGAGLSAP